MMSKVSQFLHYWYMRFFKAILANEHRTHVVMEYKVHMLLVVTLITSMLMWAYAFCSYYHVNHPSITNYGFIYAFIHMMAPLVYKYTRSITLATYTLLIPGGIFQTHFALVTGGFFTTTIVWVGILPLIAGILTDKFHTLVWGAFAMLAIIVTFALSMMGLTGDYFVDSGRTIAQFQVTFGMIIMNSAFTIFLLILTTKYEEMQKKRKIAFQNLLRIMVHDIANPLTVILNMAKSLPYVKTDPVQEEYFQNQIVLQASKMSSIIESVRWMEGLESGKKAPKVQPVNLSKVVRSSLSGVENNLRIKDMTLDLYLPEEIMVLAFLKKRLGNVKK